MTNVAVATSSQLAADAAHEVAARGGIETLVGPGSVAIPGSLAAIELAWQRYGAASWTSIFAPAIRAAREGFRLSSAGHYYLGYSGQCIFGRSDDGWGALHDGDGELREVGSNIVVPHLGDTLDAISREGARLFYEGELARRMSDHCREGGGALSYEDLSTYTAIVREPLQTTFGDWQVATNPAPAIGGAILIAMLQSCADIKATTWTSSGLKQLIRTQQACLDFRKRKLDLSRDIAADAAHLIALARDGQWLNRWTSASTVHTSAVDSDGTACSITASSGYGSGEMPVQTGLWLNNCLGEIELNRRGLDAGPVGARLPSNMAPSVARRANSVLAVGSPGADRITTALQQFLINYLLFEMPLADAIAHPRLHVDTSGESIRLMAEPGLDLRNIELPCKEFPEQGMYFGGVGAAVMNTDGSLVCAADPRREGGTCVYVS